MKSDKQRDIENRLKDSWWDVELFRIVRGRLPNKKGDDVTKKLAKEYIDRFAFGNEDIPSTRASKADLDNFAFHVYASTNLAYE